MLNWNRNSGLQIKVMKRYSYILKDTLNFYSDLSNIRVFKGVREEFR